MEENKEKSIKLAIEAMRPLPVNSFAGYCSVGDDRSPEEKHKDDMRFCKEFNELQSDMLITLASKIEAFFRCPKKELCSQSSSSFPGRKKLLWSTIY